MSLKFKVSSDTRYARWVALGLILLGALLLCIWGARVYGAARSLLSRLPEAQALMANDPLAADPQVVGALIHGVRADFVSLNRMWDGLRVWLQPFVGCPRWGRCWGMRPRIYRWRMRQRN